MTTPPPATEGHRRHSGLFSFWRWFRPPPDPPASSRSSSADSLASLESDGTVASFSFVPPSAYPEKTARRPPPDAPETDTYRARLKQRDERRRRDRHLSIARKYNLFVGEESTRSLPIIGKPVEPGGHRRTNSECSKIRKAGAYVHVKGKRRAPQPPGHKDTTLSLRSRKRMAPPPPENAIANDTLRLEHGYLKPNKDTLKAPEVSKSEDMPVSPRWYKRTDVVLRNSAVECNGEKKNEENRKSNLVYLMNISELDREAAEIVKKEQEKQVPQPFTPTQSDIQKMPTEQWMAPKKRSSAKDLIAKFNAITNVSKVNVFGASQRRSENFGKRFSIGDSKCQETLLENHKKKLEQLEKKGNTPLMKSESASSVVTKIEPNKNEKKDWSCAKCSTKNDYWRSTCHNCLSIRSHYSMSNTAKKNEEKQNVLERSKTQIGFSALANYKENDADDENSAKRKEREKLKKMLIEMKNSLPKRKTNNILLKQTGVIEEKPEIDREPETKRKEEKKAEILIGTQQTIYENIRVKFNEKNVSTSAQTDCTGMRKAEKKNEDKARTKNDAARDTKDSYEVMQKEDFDDICSEKNGRTRIYANLAQNDEFSLLFNVPKCLDSVKNKEKTLTKDTLEVNRLLRRLESAIAKGELTDASIYAKQLAELKINCSVIRQKAEDEIKKQGFTVDMYVEDKMSHRGPFPIQVTENQNVAELKLQIQKEFEIPAEIQRWILGKKLVTDDKITLKDQNITEGCSIFLYLVAPDPDLKLPKTPTKIETPSTSKVEKEISTISKINNTRPTIDLENLPSTSKTVIDIEVKNDIPRIVDVIKKTPDQQPTTSKIDHLDDTSDDDFKTLKPHRTEWKCHICTLLNPLASNICAVCSAVRQHQISKKEEPKAIYHQLMNLDSTDFVENTETFECLICFLEIPPGEGVVLRECLHQFCKGCLAHTVKYSEEAEIKCPYRNAEYSCNIALQDREIKGLVSTEIYDQYLARSIAQAENRIDKSFHCKTPDCKGWCIFEDNVNEFKCPICKRINCLTCQAIHIGLNCKQYQERMNHDSGNNEEARRTTEMLEEMVNKGEALYCPTCNVILMKKWGCDWLRCSMCKTEICWVTKGPRWGLGGKGDTSGGCKCGVNGVKCHPKCNYCH